MKKILSLALIAATVSSMTILPSFADEGEKQKPNPDIGMVEEEVQKPNPDIGVILEEPPAPPAEPDPEQVKKQAELEKWYQGLTEEQLEFVRSAIEEELKEESSLQDQKRRNEADKLKSYLKKSLAKTQYTYLSFENDLLKIGVPSTKYMDKIDSLYQKYSEKTPNQVSIFYELCPLSCKELEKAKSTLEKDSQLKKMMEKSRMSLVIHNGWIELYCTDGIPKRFESWLSGNQYQKLIRVRENQKFLPTDSIDL